MSAVKQALSKLNRAIGQLERSMDAHESTLKGKQRDMFAAPVPPLTSPIANNNNIDADLVAERLDGAIARIESVLKEGRG